MSAWIMGPGSLVKMIYNPGAIAMDLSCYCIAAEITPSTEELDIGTFCAPSLSDVGRTTYTASLTLLWEPALYTALEAHLNQVGQLNIYHGSDLTDAVRIEQCKYAAQPWGRFEVGQRVEVELPLAVLSTPIWFTS